MDGLLIDSEPLWQEAEIEVFGAFGVTLTRAMCRQTMGLRIDEVVDHWHQRFGWDDPARDEVIRRVVAEMVRRIEEEGEVKDGVAELLDHVATQVENLAIASSSNTAIIEAVMRTSGLGDRFDVIHSAEHEPYGKPHPAVYLSAAERLCVRPDRCVAFEDSLNGIIAAKAARMRCIAVPEVPAEQRKGFEVADAVVESLHDAIGAWDRLVAG